MVYDRTHTRVLDDLEGMRLNKSIPFAAVTFVVAGLASMGMPGFSGFVAEFQVLIGAWKAFPTFAVLAGFGVLLGVAYTLRAIQKSFFSGVVTAEEPIVVGAGAGAGGPIVTSVEARAPRQEEPESHPLEDITVPERIGAAILIGTTVVIGLYPQLLLELIVPALKSPLMEKLLRGGGP
jgi:NADH-quinone oxidoreductase subunit M